MDGRSVRIASPMGIAPVSPFASTRITMSRSVTMPTILPPSRTATAPIFRSAMTFAASRQGVTASSATTFRTTCLSIVAMRTSVPVSIGIARMDLRDHLDRLTGLLDLERAAERARFADARAKLSFVERAARGFIAADVEALDESGLAGRSLVSYRRHDGREVGGSQIGVGSVVKAALRREEREDAPSGVVARRTRTRIGVAFDEPPPEWATEGRVVLELQPSSVTHERLRGGGGRMA